LLWLFRRNAKVVLSLVSAVASFATVGIASASTVTVKAGDTLWSVARRNHVSMASLEAVNPNVKSTNLLVGTVLTLPVVASLQLYTVKAGDTLWLISRRFNVSLNQLVAANGNVNPSHLMPGMILHVPVTGSVLPQSSPPLTTVAASQSPSSSTASSLNQQDLYWMAHVIFAEAGGESFQAQVAVGDVVWHRMESPYYPNNVKSVVFQVVNGHYQFSCVPNGYIYSQPNQGAYQAAAAVLQQHQDLVPGAFVFYNPALTPASSWVWQQTKIADIGSFIFAK